MSSIILKNPITLHMVAIPYPLRGHINPMLNFCKSVALKRPDFLITFIVTEEWLGLLSSDPDHSRTSSNIRFATIPDFIPPVKDQDKILLAYMEAVFAKMEGLVERLLDRLDGLKPRVILYDSSVKWALGVARRRNISAASFWTMSATFFTLLYHWGYPLQNGQLLQAASLLENGENRLTFIPGIPSIRIADIPKQLRDFNSVSEKTSHEIHEIHTLTAKADYLLFTSVYELESEALDCLKKEIPVKIYTTGLAIPILSEIENPINNDHISWLDAQPKASVLYISQGSFLSSRYDQLEEYLAGIRDSGISFFWVAREKRDRLIDADCSKGLVVEWCDQLRVLCHPSIGGFWSHCGWNSIKEAAYSGLTLLASPIVFDQIPNRKTVVEDWKIGWRLNGDGDNDGRLVKREEISRVLKRFMDSECEEVKEIRKRAAEISEICKNAGSEGGASDLQIEAFIENISN